MGDHTITCIRHGEIIARHNIPEAMFDVARSAGWEVAALWAKASGRPRLTGGGGEEGIPKPRLSPPSRTTTPGGNTSWSSRHIS